MAMPQMTIGGDERTSGSLLRHPSLLNRSQELQVATLSGDSTEVIVVIGAIIVSDRYLPKVYEARQLGGGICSSESTARIMDGN